MEDVGSCLSALLLLPTSSDTLQKPPFSGTWDALGTQFLVSMSLETETRKEPPPRMGTARRLAEAYTARIVAPRHFKESVAVGTVAGQLRRCHCPKKTPASVHPRRRASRHRGFTDCIVTQKRPA